MTMDKTSELKDKSLTSTDETLKGKETTPEGKETSPKETPRTITQEQHEKLLQLALMKAGRDWKALETERDTLKEQIASKETELADIQSERESLQKEIDDLASGDSDRMTLVKQQRDLRERERKYKADLQTLEADKKAHSEKITHAEEVERELAIIDIALEYEGAKPDKLSETISEFSKKYGLRITTPEDIRMVADTIWTKKPESKEPEVQTIKGDSGVTSGGAESTEQTRLKARYPSMFKK